MSNIEYVSGGIELLDFVQPLWEKLKNHHKANSQYFSSRHENINFKTRKNKFLNSSNVNLKVDLVKDKEKYIGYCISTINKELVGEIDSLYIEKEYRKFGIGDELMKRALNWLDFNKATKKIIAVSEGNEDVLNFYKKHRFYKRSITLEQID